MNKLNRRDVLKSAGAALLTFPLLPNKTEAKEQNMGIGWHHVPNRFFDIHKESKYFDTIIKAVHGKNIELYYYFYKEQHSYTYCFKSKCEQDDKGNTINSKVLYTPRFIIDGIDKGIELIPTKEGCDKGYDIYNMVLKPYNTWHWNWIDELDRKNVNNLLVVEWNELINSMTILGL